MICQVSVCICVRIWIDGYGQLSPTKLRGAFEGLASLGEDNCQCPLVELQSYKCEAYERKSNVRQTHARQMSVRGRERRSKKVVCGGGKKHALKRWRVGVKNHALRGGA